MPLELERPAGDYSPGGNSHPFRRGNWPLEEIHWLNDVFPVPCAGNNFRVVPFKTPMGAKLRHLPLRATSGSFILNAGLGKLGADDETAKKLHSMAVGTYPFLERLDPQAFTKLLAASEVALGALLLLPRAPSRLAGLALTGFAGSLLGMYLKTPGMRQEGTIRPTPQGTPLAKDVWLLGSGLSLLVDGDGSSKKRRD